MIRFQKVSKIYSSEKIALDEVSFKIKEREFVSITGKSGAGKTTLIKLLLREEAPTKGRIFFEDVNIHRIKKRFLPQYRKNFGIVFQDYKLLPNKTVFENIAYALEVTGADDKEILNNVPQVLELVDMPDKANNFPSELSGGEKQRVAIARALIHRPRVVIADEPTGNLDPYHTWEIIHLLIKIHELGSTLILATHDKEIINYLQKRVITLDKGRIIRDEEKGRFIL
jgi:cell division transport system ATP-binding protein